MDILFDNGLHLDEIKVVARYIGSCGHDNKRHCEYCGEIDCLGNCDKCKDVEIDIRSRRNYNTMIDAIGSLILAHACAGVNVEDKKYMEGIQTAIEACANNCQAF